MDSNYHQLLLIKKKLLLQLLLKKKRSNKPRKTWVKQIFRLRLQHGAFHVLIPNLRKHDVELFKNYLRVYPDQFDELALKVGPFLKKKDVNFRKTISPEERLAVTLRYLASGDMMKSLSYQFLIAPATISVIIPETCDAIWNALCGEYLKVPSTPEEWQSIAVGFKDKWGFPNCLGAIDGKHVCIQAPFKGGSLFYNYKDFHSIVLMAVCDANYNFTFIDVGSYGHESDSTIFSNSQFGKALHNNKLNLPAEDYLPESGIKCPYVFVADEAFGLRPNLMRPFPANHLSADKKVFNYRLSRARRIIENSFGILVARFRILRKPLVAKTTTVDSVVKCACILHNYIRKSLYDDITPDREEADGTIIPGNWRDMNDENEGALKPISKGKNNNYSNKAAEVRNNFTSYFNSAEGTKFAPWQFRYINRGSF